MIVETERLTLREVDHGDASFILELLNTPKFIQYVGDRCVRDLDAARRYIDERYLSGYRENGYGMWGVVERTSGKVIGACGFVRRESLPGPDIGFSFLPEFERNGFGFESAAAVIEYGRERLGFKDVYAITTLDNEESIRLLEKLGFTVEREIDFDGETLNLFSLTI